MDDTACGTAMAVLALQSVVLPGRIYANDGMMSFHESLAALSNRFVDGHNRGDSAACAGACTDDAVLHHDRREFDSGRAAIESYSSEATKDGFVVTGLATLSAAADGRLGYAIQRLDSKASPHLVMRALMRCKTGAWKVCAEVVVAS